MSKRSVFTTITPLPAGITRLTVLDTLYTHVEMIDLNPLVEERHPIKPPSKATAEEYHCQWYELTDKVSYLPGGLASGKVTYQACFHDLANGLQTHVYAPLGLDIKNKWTLGGTLPGEPAQPVEIGQGIPMQGLYLREDVDMRCNMLMTNFVKKTLKKAHSTLVARLLVKAQLYEAASHNDRLSSRSYHSDGSPIHQSPAVPFARLSSARSLHDSFIRSAPQSPLGSPGFPSPGLPPTSYGNGNGLVPEPLTLRNQNFLSQLGHLSAQPEFNGSPYSTPLSTGYGHQMDPAFAHTFQLHRQEAQHPALMSNGRSSSQLSGTSNAPSWMSKNSMDFTGPPAYDALPNQPVELPVELPAAPAEPAEVESVSRERSRSDRMYGKFAFEE
jgi:hypothetical protein